MSEEIYQRIIMELSREAAGTGRLDTADATATIDNPLCGDVVTLDLRFDGDAVSEVGHRVRGCALCQAAAAVISRHAIGLSPETLRAVADASAAMIRTDAPAPAGWDEMAAFQPVRPIRNRHRCVLLPFEAMTAALDGSNR